MIWVDRAGVALALALPVFLVHGRGIAEALVFALAGLFLAQSAVRWDWAWLRRAWVRVGLVWWGWLLLCSARQGWDAALQAAGVGRFLLMAAGLEHWALRDAPVRAWLARVLRCAALYMALQVLVQFATGRNLFGYPRSGDGELTGPYRNPRVGPPLARLLFPAVLPVLDRWMGRGSAWRAGAAALLPGAVGVMVLVGQRMPLLLTGLGLVATGLLLPRLRRVVLGAGVAAAVLLAATPIVSPPTFWRLVVKFRNQVTDLPDSPYGQIAARAVAIAEAHPVLGAGFDGFRRDCPDPAYFGGWHGGGPLDDGGGAAMCVQHPHNFYLQALVEGGVPGLLLFMALAVAWLLRLGRGLWQRPDPLRAGLFVAALVQLWPLASTTAFTSMPLAGFFFVLLGLGLAEADGLVGLVPGCASANISEVKGAAAMPEHLSR